MGKQKTHKAITKRFKITKNGKILKRVAGQGHYNSRETGNTRRNKRTDITASATLDKVMSVAFPG